MYHTVIVSVGPVSDDALGQKVVKVNHAVNPSLFHHKYDFLVYNEDIVSDEL